MSAIKTITASQLAELQRQRHVDLIDVRTPVEFGEVRAEMARNVPLDQLDPHAVIRDRNGQPTETLYLICKAGSRGAKACQKFIDAGYPNVVNVEGGTQAWDAAGLAVIRGKKAISLERQVRITAGLIVLVAAVLALLVHPYFAVIAALVGGGLAFAGITDTCAMGLLLAKMPWNRVSTDNVSCCSSN